MIQATGKPVGPEALIEATARRCASSEDGIARATPLSVVCFGEILWDVLPRGTFLARAAECGAHLTRLV
jgi:hypothetical protein